MLVPPSSEFHSMANGLLRSGVLVHSSCMNSGKGIPYFPNLILGLTFRTCLHCSVSLVPKRKLSAPVLIGGLLHIQLCIEALIL